jgi:hypothetical protein
MDDIAPSGFDGGVDCHHTIVHAIPAAQTAADTE